jgi:hypothetical protein
VATREHAERARIQAGMYVLDLGCGLAGRRATSRPNAVAGWRRSTSPPTSSKRHAS